KHIPAAAGVRNARILHVSAGFQKVLRHNSGNYGGVLWHRVAGDSLKILGISMIEKLPAKNSAKVSRQNSRAHKQPALNGSQACRLCSQSARQFALAYCERLAEHSSSCTSAVSH